MAKGGGKGGKAIKEENEKVKQGQKKAASEQKEADDWKAGAKVKDTSKEDKRQAELARKAELARLLAEEESAAPKPKVKPAAVVSKTKVKKPVEKPAGPGALAAGGGLASMSLQNSIEVASDEPVQELYATGIDSMLEALEIANQKSDKASLGQRAAGIDAHPERRFKAALEKYIEDELPVIRKEYPGLRLQQYKERLFKSFQKHESNPFNQLTVDYNATKEEKIALLKASNDAKAARLNKA